MARILLIETSTAQLSTALAEDGIVTAFRVCGEPRMQAALTAPSVKEILDEKALAVKDLDAVCVGKGPGSYTGLRVGVSTAKGLCFGAGIPLLSAGTLDVLVSEAHRLGVVPAGCRAIVPMVDARRMEVYAAVFAPDGRQLTETAPVIVGPDSFADRLAEGPVLSSVTAPSSAARCSPPRTPSSPKPSLPRWRWRPSPRPRTKKNGSKTSRTSNRSTSRISSLRFRGRNSFNPESTAVSPADTAAYPPRPGQRRSDPCPHRPGRRPSEAWRGRRG